MRVESMISEVIRREGGYVNHASDRGGPTNYGITLGMLEQHRGDGVKLTADDVREMSEQEARLIYRSIFIAQPKIDTLPNETIASLVFDFGVHSGSRKAIKVLQMVLGLQDDGIIGHRTREAVAREDTRKLAIRYLGERAEYLAAIVAHNPSQAVFIRGWIRRVKDLMNEVVDGHG